MKNSLQLVINIVLGVAVAVLFYLHFASKPAAPAKKPAVAAATPAAPGAALAATEEASEAETAAPADTNKVAYVESVKLLDGYQGMKDARKNFETKARRWEAQNKSLVQGFQAAVQQYQQKAEGMTQEQRAATEQQLQGRQMQVAQEQEKLQRTAAEEEAKLNDQVLGRMKKQIERYGKQNGYRLILLDGSGNTIAYGSQDLNITTQVLAYLNNEYRSGKKK